MVRIEHENMVIRTTIHNLSTTTSKSSFISKENSEKIANVDILPYVILQQHSSRFHENKGKQQIDLFDI